MRIETLIYKIRGICVLLEYYDYRNRQINYGNI